MVKTLIAVTLMVCCLFVFNRASWADCYRGDKDCRVGNGCLVWIDPGTRWPSSGGLDPRAPSDGKLVMPDRWAYVFLGRGCRIVTDVSGYEGCINDWEPYYNPDTGMVDWASYSDADTGIVGCCARPCPPPGTGCEND